MYQNIRIMRRNREQCRGKVVGGEERDLNLWIRLLQSAFWHLAKSCKKQITPVPIITTHIEKDGAVSKGSELKISLDRKTKVNDQKKK